MPLAPELRDAFVGQRVHIQSMKGGYVHFTATPGEDDDDAWVGLTPEDHANVKSRLLRLGVGRQLWATKCRSLEVRSLLISACEALDSLEDAIQGALAVRPWDQDDALETRARDEVLAPLVNWFASNADRRQSFERTSERRIMHWFARRALPRLGRVLRDAKREARTSPRPMFKDPEWQERTASSVSEVLRSFLLPGKCSLKVLVQLRDEEPRNFAVELLSWCTGLSTDDLTRRSLPI